MKGTFQKEHVDALIRKYMPRIVEVRRQIHSDPELGFSETRTSALVRNLLLELGLEVKDGDNKTGVIALMKGANPGPVVGLRADLDALPIQERTKLPFQSANTGVMHACGHDGHIAMALGTAMVLRELTHELHGTVKFIFQPAEELLKGAQYMIQRGVLENPSLDFVYAYHLWPALPLGHIGVKPGVAMASAARFQVTIDGIGGHGANPHLATDPIVAASNWITLLQNIVSRKTDPVEPAVVSIGKIEGGTSYNTIASSVSIEGTIRAVTKEAHQRLPELLEANLKGISTSTKTLYTLDYEDLCPPLMNAQHEAKEILDLAQRLFGEERVVQLLHPSMVAEDFALFLEHSRGCMVFLGIGEPNRDNSLHSDTFDFDEEVMFDGTKFMVMSLLSKGMEENLAGQTKELTD